PRKKFDEFPPPHGFTRRQGLDRVMSALSHFGSRNCALGHTKRAFGMSALPPKADIADRDGHVRFMPKTDIQFGFAGNGSSTLYLIIGRRMPLSQNSPTGSIVTAFSTACRTWALMRI